MSDTIHQVKVAIQNRVQSSALIQANSIPIFTDDEANLPGKIDAAIQGETAKGIFGLVRVASGTDSAGTPFAPLLYSFAVEFHEHRFVNRQTAENADTFKGTGLLAEELAENARLHLKSWNVPGLLQSIPTTPALVFRVQQVFGDWACAAQQDVQCLVMEFSGRCQRPSATVAEGLCTLASSTSGANIFYALDTTFPSEAAGATLYLAPFEIQAGETVRACAYKTGLIPSDITQHTA